MDLILIFLQIFICIISVRILIVKLKYIFLIAMFIYFGLFFIGYMENLLIITGIVFIGAIISLYVDTLKPIKDE